ncbi:MAG TPA: glycosyltransferase family 39 protein [Thermoanaerobaculia bacterium]
MEKVVTTHNGDLPHCHPEQSEGSGGRKTESQDSGRKVWRTPGGIVVLVLAVSTLLRLVVASSVGFLTGDDVEVLEAAFVPVTGLHYQAWEIRNLLFPRLLVAPVLAAASGLGIHDPFALVRIAALPFVALSALNGWLVYRLACRLVDRWTAALAAGVFSFHWLPLAYGGTVYPRTVSTTCVLLAALLIAREGRGLAQSLRALGAGALVALGFADRYSEAIFLAPLLAFALWRARERDQEGQRGWLARAAGPCGALVVGFALGSLVTVGLSDLAFWGKPFASLAAFARFTLLERRSSSLVTHQPWGWYLARLYVWLPPTLLPFLCMLRRRRGLLLPWLGLALPLLVLSLVHHKELRYLQGGVPFLAILVAAGAAGLWRAGWRRVTIGLLAASLLLSLNTARSVLSRRSLAAVAAARDLGADPAVRTVALSQAWAYGHLLFFGDRVAVLDLATPPAEEEVRKALAGVGVDALGLYADDLARAPSLALLVESAGFARAAVYRSWNSKPVVVFRRRSRSASSRAYLTRALSFCRLISVG